MTSILVRSGMPQHFGIRIIEADKDKLVGELDVDDRHLNNSGHVHGGALAVLPEARYRIPPFSRVIPGLGAMALGIARTAIETFSEIAGAKTPERTTQMLRNNHGAQIRGARQSG